jgi:hypothetical protein
MKPLNFNLFTVTVVPNEQQKSSTATRLRFHGIVSGYTEAIPPGFLVLFFAANLFPDAVIPGMAKPSALSGALNKTNKTSGSLRTK